MIEIRRLVFRLGGVLLAAGTVAASPVLAQGAAVSVTAVSGGAAPSLAAPGAGAAQPAGDTSQKPSFEVASIKPTHSGIGSSFGWAGDRFTTKNMRLKTLIEIAYGLKDFQVSGGPGWIGSDGYDIDAKADSLIKLTGSERLAQLGLMLQSLLADRFKLVLRHETKIFPVYRLIAAKGGPKLSAATGGSGWSEGNGQIKARAITMATLADILSIQLKRKVVDETNLPGTYDISLRWSPDNGAAAPGMPTAGAEGGPLQRGAAAASIFTALQEQLGLKLEAGKAPVETVVVVQVERPSEN